jgi:uncharacterized surface protein with fasciclin (FAS1) repeats
MMKTVLALFAAVAVAAAEPNIVQLAESVPDLSTLVKAVSAGGLVPTLEGPGPFTVFAPTNEAFGELPPGTLEKLLDPKNKPLLVKILTYHVVAGKATASSLSNGESIKTVEGANVTVRIVGGHVFIEGGSKMDISQVIKADVMASNGVVHVINKVLIPATMLEELMMPAAGNIIEIASATPSLSTLVVAVKAAGLVQTLEGPGPFTVLAPTNTAFAAIPPAELKKLLEPENKPLLVKVLTYHVIGGAVKAADLKDGEMVKTVEGDDVTVHIKSGHVYFQGYSTKDLAEVTTADVIASNGVVHIIDAVLVPEMKLESPSEPNIVQLAESVPTLSTLVKAVVAAGLVDTLEGPGPFTVFAPTNDAFAALPSGLLEKLLEPQNKPILIKVLTYHVASGAVKSGDLSNDEEIPTVEGEKLTVHILRKMVYIQGGSRSDVATVTSADNMASNGVVHIVSRVLVPEHLIAELA